jgi:hypothetical protein
VERSAVTRGKAGGKKTGRASVRDMVLRALEEGSVE